MTHRNKLGRTPWVELGRPPSSIFYLTNFTSHRNPFATHHQGWCDFQLDAARDHRRLTNKKFQCQKIFARSAL
jgi:hypothetical protein